MDPRQRKQEARRLFLELAELGDRERSAALTRACGDDAPLRAEVDALFRAHSAAGEFLAHPTGQVPAASPAVAPASKEQAGASIGRYKLLEQIGEGGMGTIWMAEQREPVKRRVALKIIKLGMDTKQVIARFEAERQALAMMDHPHIAKVLDAGATDTGRPYFVMEYIKGIPILEYCDKERLDTQARLALFTSVCHAIQHAHQKGIIHRDIKPSNVLVTLHDGTPVPKVIDFGIAKATNHELTTKTLFTEHRQMIGTPAYMSPEQAEMSGLDIDTRSDIYALGVLLYELLTGTTPFDTKALLESGYHEMLRAIREDEPHKPSTRISTLGDTGTRTAQQRQVDSKKLSALLRGDLDWIVMKCLEKDRSRRYDTATGLAADIKRHLADEPVTAGAPSAGYKLRKFAKRNRAQVIAAGTIAAVLVLGVIGTSLGLVRALDEKERADIEAQKATLAARAEVSARMVAQENARKALAAAKVAEQAQQEEAAARKRAESISGFVTTALRSSDAENAGGGQDTTILAAMQNAIADIDSGRFSDDPDIEAQLRLVIARILVNNGRAAQAEPLAARALEIARRLYEGDHAHLVTALDTLAFVMRSQGRGAAAEPLQVEALEMCRRLFPGDSPAVATALNNLANARTQLGRPADAEKLLVQSLEMNQRLYSGDHPEIATALFNLGTALRDQGRWAESESMLVQSLAMRKRLVRGDHPAVAAALNNLAETLEPQGRLAEAEPLFVQALEMDRRLYRGDHPNVAVDLGDLATARTSLGKHAEAEQGFVECLEMLRRIYHGDNPDVAKALDNLGKARSALGRQDEAEELLVEALAMRRRLYKDDHPDLFTGRHNLIRTRIEMGLMEEAEPLLIEQLEIMQRSLSADHRDVLACKRDLGVVYWSLKQFDKSVPLFEEVLRGQEREHGRKDPGTLNIVANLGVNYRDAGRFKEAIPLLEEAYAAAKKIPALAWVGRALLEAYGRAGESDVPVDAGALVAVVQEGLAAARSALPAGSRQLADPMAQLGMLLLTHELWDAAEPLMRELLAIREKKQPDAWNTFNAQALLGRVLLGQKKFAEAEPLLISGYRGMKARESSIPPAGRIRIRETIERLVELYEAQGNTAEAGVWRGELEAASKGAQR